MNKEIKLDEWLHGTTPLPVQTPVQTEMVPNIIDLSQFKNFNQIKPGLGIKTQKTVLMTNPNGYQKFFDEIGEAAKADGITVAIVDAGDSFIVTFK